ncbi:hypothetical protein ncot_15520 [Nocardioides sp. JQ2195]|uniref:hypothetical protein n=1 Tax=Nocardioides sp. JQ2195 TaxID=2592334 RepID=UPI00143EC3CC|nr:hypothetical protein [Nocardioides sp. JQ2195]QIX27840.1 hypothetical protein ncot_15520 [Nocardioides sp. JQ2195]
MTERQPATTVQPRRAKHLMDPSNPRRQVDPEQLREEKRKLQNVQRWVGSTLAVTTILHMAAGLVIAAMVVPDDRLDAKIGLNVIAGAFGVLSVAAGLVIHARPVLSWWLLLGVLVTPIGLLATFA